MAKRAILLTSEELLTLLIVAGLVDRFFKNMKPGDNDLAGSMEKLADTAAEISEIITTRLSL